jgi:hypothetical protein
MRVLVMTCTGDHCVDPEREVQILRAKLAGIADHLTTVLAELHEARLKLSIVATPQENVWMWQGDGDEPESLSCPVVMSAETLRSLLGPGKENQTLRMMIQDQSVEIQELRHAWQTVAAERKIRGDIIDEQLKKIQRLYEGFDAAITLAQEGWALTGDVVGGPHQSDGHEDVEIARLKALLHEEQNR